MEVACMNLPNRNQLTALHALCNEAILKEALDACRLSAVGAGSNPNLQFSWEALRF